MNQTEKLTAADVAAVAWYRMGRQTQRCAAAGSPRDCSEQWREFYLSLEPLLWQAKGLHARNREFDLLLECRQQAYEQWQLTE